MTDEKQDPRYQMPLKGVSVEQLPVLLRSALTAVLDEFPPGTGAIVFAFDFGKKGSMAYISNAERMTAVEAIREWIRRQEAENDERT